MTEKYKIYIPEGMRSRLMNDAELFEFFKKDDSINLNAFLKELLINYSDQYRIKKETLLNSIVSDLEEFPSISKKDADKIADKIINTYLKSEKYQSGRNTPLTLTVSGDSLDVMRSIENNNLSCMSLSQYVNDLFASYLSIARNDREAIIFKDTFEEVREAIRKRKIITFSPSSVPDKVFSIKPYFIAASKEEQCNYLLCTDTERGLLRTFRLSRIKALYTTSETFEINEDVRDQLWDIAIKSPQSASRTTVAAVRFTERGIEKFHVIVKNRPEVLRKDGNIFYFDWPRHQLQEYFKRFGADAVIISPEEYTQSMAGFFGRAMKAYTKQLSPNNPS